MYKNVKMRPVETIPRMKGGEITENDGGGELNYDILLKTSINVTIIE
jgi:hypothetical protein